MTKGTGTCVVHGVRHGLAKLGFVLAVLLALTSIPIARFYQAAWPRVRQLPALVHQRDQRYRGQWVNLDQVSVWVPKALVATEDRTFWSNLGVSLDGMARALLVDLKTHRFAQGGSTLTQQLARDMLLSPAKTFRRKVSEALLAVMITALYSKRQILTMYLNEVYLGNSSYGIEAASRRYFDVPASRLNLAQAAMLAGLPQAPSLDDPLVHWHLAKVRQREVLQSMVQDRVISPQAARRAYRAPLRLIGPAHKARNGGPH